MVAVPDEIPVCEFRIFIRIFAYIVQACRDRVARSFQNTADNLSNIETALKMHNSGSRNDNHILLAHFP